MRVALYARYSSERQKETSIADQFRLCRKLAKRNGWTVVFEHRDHPISGATAFRPGFEALQRDVNAGRVDVVVAEGLDRLSRDQEHTAKFYKACRFRTVKIVTLSEGEITELHVGFTSTINSVFLKKLSENTRRGNEGAVLTGRSGGGACFGYRISPDGAWIVYEPEADHVRRIFREYVAGMSPREIAKQLNRDRVPGPGGGSWGPRTIHGHQSRGTGVLNNTKYIGQEIWGRLRYVKDPETGRRVSRLNPESEWAVIEREHLRIIDDETWRAAKRRQEETRIKIARTPHRNIVTARRPKFLFSEKVKCGVCGRPYVVYNRERLRCTGNRDRGTCTNALTIRRDELEHRVLRACRERLWNDQLIEEFVREFTAVVNRAKHGGSRTPARPGREHPPHRPRERPEARVSGVPAGAQSRS